LFVEPIANAKSEGKEAFLNGDYGYALYCFMRVSIYIYIFERTIYNITCALGWYEMLRDFISRT